MHENDIQSKDAIIQALQDQSFGNSDVSIVFHADSSFSAEDEKLAKELQDAYEASLPVIRSSLAIPDDDDNAPVGLIRKR